MAVFGCASPKLDSPEQDQDQENDKDYPDYARRTITPARAVRPSRDNAQEDQDQDNDKNGTE
jgi:hypothetical protein